MKKLILIVVIFSSLLFVSCSSVTSTITPQHEQNAISISAPPELNTYKINDFVTILIQNKSENKIALSDENGIILSLKSDDKWINIKNMMMNSLNGKTILQPQSQPEENSITVDIVPDIQNTTMAIVRITITGTDLSTNQIIQNYIDVTLSR